MAGDIPAGTPMPTPVRDFGAAVAAFAEGFCPTCLRPIDRSIGPFRSCWKCGAIWRYDRNPVVAFIEWTCSVGAIVWRIRTFDTDPQRVRGTAVWAE